jgi:hypothetical protein
MWRAEVLAYFPSYRQRPHSDTETQRPSQSARGLMRLCLTATKLKIAVRMATMEACVHGTIMLLVKTFYSSAGLVDRDSGILFLRMTGARMFGMGLWMDVSERVFDHLVGVSERVHRCDRRSRLERICRHQHTFRTICRLQVPSRPEEDRGSIELST